MPPLQALAALHGFWCMMVLPFAVWAARAWPPDRLRRAGRLVTALGLGALAGFLSVDVSRWLADSPPEFRQYVPQRMLFRLATLVDVPLLPVTLAAAACWWVGTWRAGCARSDEPGAGSG